MIILFKKKEELFLSWIAIAKATVQELLADFEVVTSCEITSTTCDWIASTIHI